MLRHKQLVHKDQNDEDESIVSEDSENETDPQAGEEEDDTDVSQIDENETDDEDEDLTVWDHFKEKALSAITKGKSFSDLNVNGGSTDLYGEKSDDETTQEENEEILDRISGYYTTALTINHWLAKDPVHKRIMITKQRLIDDEEYDTLEAIDAAVKIRRQAIAQACGMKPYIPSNEDMDVVEQE